jgi:hypothetical protein
LGNSTPPPYLLTGAADGKDWLSGSMSNKWRIVAAKRIISPVAKRRPEHYKSTPLRRILLMQFVGTIVGGKQNVKEKIEKKGENAYSCWV